MEDVPAGFKVRYINRSTWVTPDFYDNMTPIGAGAFGTVCSAVDMRNGMPVAIKKLQKPFQTKVHAQRAFREIKLLRYIQHENVIGLIDLFRARAPGSDTDDIYLVTELMGSDLHSIIHSQIVSDEHIQFLVYQILRALKYVHSAGLVHRDLKPGNVAINQDCDLKILDFGLARVAALEGSMTGYVATRWYRAPEVILRWGNYSSAVDMWSVGCIMAELLLGEALFQGRDNVEQLVKVTQLLGKPTPEFMATIESAHARSYVDALPDHPPVPYELKFQNCNPLAVDLLSKLLVYDTNQRLTADQAIQHPYFQKFHDAEDEPMAEMPFDDSFEHLDLDVEGWKAMVFQEVDDFQLFRIQQQQALLYQQMLMQQQQLGQPVS